MTYAEAISYINSTQMFGQKPSLARITALMQALGDPQDKLKFVHVAGTNGKGSTCAMLAGILQAAGYKTGLFTSPYLHRYNERVRVNGRSISDEALAAAVEQVKAAADGLGIAFTEFELDTAIGFVHFAREKCAVVVLEVGLGGRFDATNVIKCPECAVIANIGLDHTAILGGTVEEIAAEKAGIIKEGGRVAAYCPEQESVERLLAKICRERGASLRIADFDEIALLSDSLEGQRFCYCDDEPLFLGLLGDHQLRNAAVALEAVEILRERGFRISADAVKTGLAEVKWPARFELLSREPYFVVDGGHNVQCAGAVRENAAYYFDGLRRVLLLGILADKDVDGFLDTLADTGDAYVCVQPDSPRALSAEALGQRMARYGKPVFVCGSIAEGIRTAVGAAGASGAVLCTGSLYMAGNVRAYFGRE